MRTMRPDSGPRPAPISMLKSSRSCFLTAASLHAIGHADRVERPEALPFGRQQLEAHGAERRGKDEVVAPMARPPRFEALLLYGQERLAQRVDQRCRDGVVVLAPDPVVLEQLIGRGRSFAWERAVSIARGREHDRAPARTEDPTHFCVPAVADIEAPRLPTSSGCPPSDVTASTIVRAPCSRAAATIRLDQGSARRSTSPRAPPATTSAPSFFEAPFRTSSGSHARPHSTSTRVTVASVPPAHLGQTIAEVARHYHESTGAFSNDVRDGSFHTRSARTRYGKHQRALGSLEQSGKPLADVVHHGEQVRIEMTQDRRGHRSHDTRGNHAWPGAEKDAFGSWKSNHWSVLSRLVYEAKDALPARQRRQGWPKRRYPPQPDRSGRSADVRIPLLARYGPYSVSPASANSSRATSCERMASLAESLAGRRGRRGAPPT
jgi:hypothetical protein